MNFRGKTPRTAHFPCVGFAAGAGSERFRADLPHRGRAVVMAPTKPFFFIDRACRAEEMSAALEPAALTVFGTRT